MARIGYSCVKHDIKYLYYGKTFFKLATRRIINKINSSSAKMGGIVSSGNETRIWLFGGSTTACSYEEDERSWPYKLAVYLKRTLDSSVEVVNSEKTELHAKNTSSSWSRSLPPIPCLLLMQ